MGRGKGHKSRVEILLDSPVVYLKGVGDDVEPASLSGHVALYLTEATSVKEITLRFKGEARLPVPSSYSLGVNTAPLTYVVCSHEWSFLEGEERHSRTLNPGRYLFPFQLGIGRLLPSTISSPVSRGATVSYKLRARVVRAPFGFCRNLRATFAVPIVRSFGPEAMEYQRTLEVENTWPEMVMCSITIPHKAWAAGDKVTALANFSPLAKGTRVLSISTAVKEHTQVYTRIGTQGSTRVVARLKHEILNGRAVEVVESRRGKRCRRPSSLSTGQSVFTETGPLSGSLDETRDVEIESSDLVTYLSIPLPLTVTPSHALLPIRVAHYIVWKILIMTLDGQTSELRCSLPLHLLDHRLLNESKAYSAPARRLLLGDSEVPVGQENDGLLPSYSAHLRDRVANMFLPESVTVRVANPWLSQSTSPRHGFIPSLAPQPVSGYGSLENLPYQPGPPETSTPLEWINSELLLSLSEDSLPHLREWPPESSSDSDPNSWTHSRRSSTAISNLSSRMPQSSEQDRDRRSGSGHDETSVHEGYASRAIHHLFNASLRPLSSAFSPAHWIGRSQQAPGTGVAREREQQSQGEVHRVRSGPCGGRMGTELLHRAFTEVPDYGIASRGFIGGVPPLSSTEGLPSYEETQRLV